MKNFLKASLAVSVFAATAVFTNIKAQATIDPVNITKTETSKKLEKAIADNINSEALVLVEPGSYSSNVKFTVNENGKLSNISAEGENIFVDREIERTVAGMNMKKVANLKSDRYVLPVSLDLE